MTSETATYKCDICKDLEYVPQVIDGHEYMVECVCKAQRDHERAIKFSGVLNKFKSKTFSNFEETENNKRLKKACMNYVKTKAYSQAKSLMLLGQVGSGKTHLAMAIANNLMSKGVRVRYLDYRGFITKIKQSMLDREEYQCEMEIAKKSDILFIDDLFKGKVNETDINIMYEIINTRYLADLPVIITSEMSPVDIVEFDEGLGSRLMEMAEDYMLISKGENKRLEKWTK